MVVDDESNRYLAPYGRALQPNETDWHYWYGHDGKLRTNRPHVQCLTGNLVYRQRIRLNQSGAPYDSFLLSDAAENAGRYKLWIFLNAFENREELQKAVAAIKTAGGTIIFTYGAGFIDADGISADKMSQLIGMKVEEDRKRFSAVVWNRPAPMGLIVPFLERVRRFRTICCRRP